MTSIAVTLPDDLAAFAEARAAEERVDSVAAYLGALLRREREREARLLAAIEGGRASGISEDDPFAYLDELRRGLRPGADAA